MQALKNSRSLFSKIQYNYSINKKVNRWQNPNLSKVIIIGAGYAGLTLAAYIPKFCYLAYNAVKIVESNPYFYYSPNLDLVPFNIKTIEEIEKPVLQCINDYIQIDFSEVTKINPETNTILTTYNKEYEYDYLFLANGIKPDLDSVKGLREALDDHDIPVVSIHNNNSAMKAHYHYQRFTDGKVIFYNSQRPKQIQSAINHALLFEEYLRKDKGKNIRKLSNITYISSQADIFPIIPYASQLNQIFKQKNIETLYSNELIEVIPEHRLARFKNTISGEIEEKYFDLLYISPNTLQSDLLNNSPDLLNDHGILDLDTKHLVHLRYPNIFAIGHNTTISPSLSPTSAFCSASSIIKQSLIVTHNFQLTMNADAQKSKPELIEYHDNSIIPIYTGNKRCLKLYTDPKKIPQVNESKSIKPSLKSYITEIYLSQYLFHKYLCKGKWFGEYGFKPPATFT